MKDNKNDVWFEEEVNEMFADGMQNGEIPVRTVPHRVHKSKTRYMVTLAILTALVVVLQLWGSAIPMPGST